MKVDSAGTCDPLAKECLAKKGDVSHLWIGLSLMSSVRAARSGRHPVVAPRLQPASPEGIPGRKLHVRYWMVRGWMFVTVHTLFIPDSSP